MLHEEQGGANKTAGPPGDAERPTFSFRPQEELKRPAPPKPVGVRIETDREKSGDGGVKARIVHYSKFRTPLDETRE